MDLFCGGFVARFRDDSKENVVEKFNKLQQTSSIEAYLDEFENYRSLMLQKGHLTYEYIIDCFIGGLKIAIKPFVKAFRLATITFSMEYASFPEKSLNCSSNKTTRPT